MSLNFYEEARSNGERCRKVPVNTWAGRQFERQFGSFRNSVPAIQSDVRIAIEQGTLTPDFGEIQWAFNAGSSAMEYPRYHRFFGIPLELNKPFERLARAHGLSPCAALSMLVTWRALHGWPDE